MTSLRASYLQSDDHVWWAVYTRHQHERTVVQKLTENGFETFLPSYQAVRQWKDRKKCLLLPLFPCYVFVSGSSERRVQVLSTPGVFLIVSSGGHPARIPTQEIDDIRRAVGSSLRVEPHPFLRCGDWVRIKSGPLIDVEGILVRKKGSYRLILSAELLQKSFAVEVDALSVEPLPNRVTRAVGANMGTTHVFDRSHTSEWHALAGQEYGERTP